MSGQTITETSMNTVSGPESLPGGSPLLSYIVSSIDPHYLIAGRSGDVYVREDGAEWEGDGFHVSQPIGGLKSWTYAALKLD